MPQSAYTPPVLHLALPGVTAELKTAWCTPGLLGYAVTASGEPVVVPKPEKKKVEEKDKKKVEEKKKVGPPVLAPVPVAVRDVAAALAALAALTAASKFLKNLAGKAAGKALVYAEVVAVVSLFKLAEAKGQTIPDDLKEAMRNDPQLRESLSKAVKTGNFDEAQREAGERVARAIAAHHDEFTEEELNILLNATEGAKGSIPNGDATVQELKRAIEAKRKGGGAGPSAGPVGGGEGRSVDGKTGSATGPTAERLAGPSPAAPSAPPKGPEERLVEGMARKGADGPKFTPALKEKLLVVARAVNPPLTDAEVDKLLTRLEPAAGKSEEEIVDSVREGVKTLRSGKDGEAGPAAPEASEGTNEPGNKSGGVATDDIAVKSKQGKKDPKTEADLEKKIGRRVKVGETRIAGPRDIVCASGKPFSGFIYGRDSEGSLFIGRGPITPRLVDGAWRLEVQAGIQLFGAAGAYGATKSLTIPAFAGACQGPKAPVK
jgi:hypothetical protein